MLRFLMESFTPLRLAGVARNTAKEAIKEGVGQFGAELHQIDPPDPVVEPAPVYTTETPAEVVEEVEERPVAQEPPAPEPEPIPEPPAPRRKNSARLQYRLEGVMVNDADYMIKRLAEIIPDPSVMRAIARGLDKIGEQLGGTVD